MSQGEEMTNTYIPHTPYLILHVPYLTPHTCASVGAAWSIRAAGAVVGFVVGHDGHSCFGGWQFRARGANGGVWGGRTETPPPSSGVLVVVSTTTTATATATTSASTAAPTASTTSVWS